MTKPVLLADVGNSRVKVCLLGHSRVTTFDWQAGAGRRELRALVEDLQPQFIYVASTSPRADAFLNNECWFSFPLQQLRATDVPLEILTEGTGMDRLLSAWITWQQCQSAVLVADCGTAFTVDFVDAEGRFQGGAIGAGLSVQERALAEACPHLDAPLNSAAAIPPNTAGAVFAGTSLAMSYAIEGLAHRFEQEQTCQAQRFLSGGDSPRIQEFLPTWQRCENLVLEALAAYARREH
ncbi:MAG: type III pantothenate kinase [Planctomycetes bacterium]|nr:type III pantothenate kinase [Planctomycetota bacterium]